MTVCKRCNGKVNLFNCFFEKGKPVCMTCVEKQIGVKNEDS